MNKPIFILGCTKSGTTLLRNLFDGHPDLFVIPTETHFFQNINYWVSYHFRRTKNQNLTFDEMKANLFNWIKFQNSVNNKIADGFSFKKWDLGILEQELFSTETNTIRELSNTYYNALCKSLYNKNIAPDKRIVEKSVENSEFVFELNQLYPDAKFVHILRNPYSNIVAIRKYISKKNSTSLKHAVYAMYNSYYNLYKNARLFDNYKVIRYEDLITNPTQTMQDLANFVEIEYIPKLLQPSFLSQPWDGNSSSGEKFDSISPGNATKWTNKIWPIEIEIVNTLFDFVLNDYDFEKISNKKSIFRINPGESPKNYLLNRILLYYMPKF